MPLLSGRAARKAVTIPSAAGCLGSSCKAISTGASARGSAAWAVCVNPSARFQLLRQHRRSRERLQRRDPRRGLAQRLFEHLLEDARHGLLVTGNREEARQRTDQRRSILRGRLHDQRTQRLDRFARPAECDQQLHDIAVGIDRPGQGSAPGACGGERLIACAGLERDVRSALEQLLVALAACSIEHDLEGSAGRSVAQLQFAEQQLVEELGIEGRIDDRARFGDGASVAPGAAARAHRQASVRGRRQCLQRVGGACGGLGMQASTAPLARFDSSRAPSCRAPDAADDRAVRPVYRPAAKHASARRPRAAIARSVRGSRALPDNSRMPELPEVEITRQSFAERIAGARIIGVRIGKPLRWPLGCDDVSLLEQTVGHAQRRGKWLWLPIDRGGLLMHLACRARSPFPSSWVNPVRTTISNLLTTRGSLRLTDPRRFGAVVWSPDLSSGSAAKLLASLGIEPFDPAFDGNHLHAALQRRRVAIKQALLAATSSWVPATSTPARPCMLRESIRAPAVIGSAGRAASGLRRHCGPRSAARSHWVGRRCATSAMHTAWPASSSCRRVCMGAPARTAGAAAVLSGASSRVSARPSSAPDANAADRIHEPGRRSDRVAARLCRTHRRMATQRRPQCAAVAAHARPVSRLAVRNHAAADAGGHRAGVLRALAGALPRPGEPGRGAAR